MAILLCLTGLAAAPEAPSPQALRRFHEGVALQQGGDWDGAARAYRAALSVAPRFAQAHANLGAALARLGRYAEAVACYQEALRLAPDLSQAYLNLGIAHLRAGQSAKAVAPIERYLRAQPDSLQARQLLGVALVEAGRDAEAVPHLQQALALGGDEPGVLLSLGIAYTRLGRPEADDVARRLNETPAGRPAYHLLRGLALQDEQQHASALRELDQAAAAGLDTPRLHLARGFSLLVLGRGREAIASLQGVVAGAPAEYQGFFYLAYAYDRQGELAKCRENAEAAHALAPDSPDVNALLGKVRLEGGHAAEAIGPLRAAVRANPKDTQTRYLLARAYRAVGRRADALRELEEVQKLMDAGYQDEIVFPRARSPVPKP